MPISWKLWNMPCAGRITPLAYLQEQVERAYGVCSGLSIMDGWRAYSIKDICAAAFQAGRKQDLSPSARLTRFLDRLEGRELTPPPGPFPGVELEEGGDIPISQSWMEGP